MSPRYFDHTAEAKDRLPEEVERLWGLVVEAREVQWLPSRKPGTAEDAGIRSKGVHSDPTADTAMDEKRLRLREALRAAEAAIQAMSNAALRAAVALEQALESWAGDREV